MPVRAGCRARRFGTARTLPPFSPVILGCFYKNCGRIFRQNALSAPRRGQPHLPALPPRGAVTACSAAHGQPCRCRTSFGTARTLLYFSPVILVCFHKKGGRLFRQNALSAPRRWQPHLPALPPRGAVTACSAAHGQLCRCRTSFGTARTPSAFFSCYFAGKKALFPALCRIFSAKNPARNTAGRTAHPTFYRSADLFGTARTLPSFSPVILGCFYKNCGRIFRQTAPSAPRHGQPHLPALPPVVTAAACSAAHGQPCRCRTSFGTARTPSAFFSCYFAR